MRLGRRAQPGAWTTINEKPPEFPQGVIACRTPCALEPDVSEANSFSQIGRRYGLGSWAISLARDPWLCAPPSPAVCPFREFRLLFKAKTMPRCNHCHTNNESHDLGKVLYCFL